MLGVLASGVASEEREQVGHSAVCSAAGAAIFVNSGLSGGDWDTGSGSLEEEPCAGGVVAEAAVGGVVGAQGAARDDFGEDVWGALPEVPASFPCVVEEFD